MGVEKQKSQRGKESNQQNKTAKSPPPHSTPKLMKKRRNKKKTLSGFINERRSSTQKKNGHVHALPGNALPGIYYGIHPFSFSRDQRKRGRDGLPPIKARLQPGTYCTLTTLGPRVHRTKAHARHSIFQTLEGRGPSSFPFPFIHPPTHPPKTSPPNLYSKPSSVYFSPCPRASPHTRTKEKPTYY